MAVRRPPRARGGRRPASASSDVVLDMGWGRLVLGQAFADPHELFVDPSYTYRLPLHAYRQRRESFRDLQVRTVRSRSELEEVDRIYVGAGMVRSDVDTMWANQRTRAFTPARRWCGAWASSRPRRCVSSARTPSTSSSTAPARPASTR